MTARVLRSTGAFLLAGTLACGRPAPEAQAEDYVQRLASARIEKDEAFKEAVDSPVPASRREELLPLAYFPPEPDYSVPAVLRPDDDRTLVEVPTSTGQVRAMERVGVLEFTLKGRQLSLGAFVEAGSRSVDRLFVPFIDLTSGTETYPAGRYLDLDRTATGLYEIDFNRAYHPYCYYNPTYDCPFPPSENRLPVPIRAGERLKEPLAPPGS